MSLMLMERRGEEKQEEEEDTKVDHLLKFVSMNSKTYAPLTKRLCEEAEKEA